MNYYKNFKNFIMLSIYGAIITIKRGGGKTFWSIARPRDNSIAIP